VAAQLVASRVVLSSTELVSFLVVGNLDHMKGVGPNFQEGCAYCIT
jgi:hypothetical protein